MRITSNVAVKMKENNIIGPYSFFKVLHECLVRALNTLLYSAWGICDGLVFTLSIYNHAEIRQAIIYNEKMIYVN